MSKVAIVSDSNSGITQSMAKELGVTVMPMPFFVGDKTLYEDIDLSQEEFYQMLSEKTDIHTSMPLVGNVTDTWDELLKEYDEIVHIPMSSGLSGSCETAMMLSRDYDGKVQVVNNQRISVTQRQSVLDALALAKQGRTASEIKTILERDKFESSIYIMVDTLYYLKKGGRITPAAAALGTLVLLIPFPMLFVILAAIILAILLFLNFCTYAAPFPLFSYHSLFFEFLYISIIKIIYKCLKNASAVVVFLY